MRTGACGTYGKLEGKSNTMNYCPHNLNAIEERIKSYRTMLIERKDEPEWKDFLREALNHEIAYSKKSNNEHLIWCKGNMHLLRNV